MSGVGVWEVSKVTSLRLEDETDETSLVSMGFEGVLLSPSYQQRPLSLWTG